MPRKKPGGRSGWSSAPLTWRDVCALGLALPEVEESTSYGTPSLKVRGKLLLRLREDGETLAMRIDPDDRDFLLATNPDTFFTTDHYRGWPAILVRLSRVRGAHLRELMEDSWRHMASKRAIAARDTGASPPARPAAGRPRARTRRAR